jgi:hypothetical protein
VGFDANHASDGIVLALCAAEELVLLTSKRSTLKDPEFNIKWHTMLAGLVKKHGDTARL